MNANTEIRIFNIERGRGGHINYAVLCNGRTHYAAERGLNSIRGGYDATTHCDGKACQGPGSEVLDISLLSSDSQETLGLSARVPQRMVLVVGGWTYVYDKGYNHAIESGALVTPKLLESGRLLAEGESTTYTEDNKTVYYLRNVKGMPDEHRVGRKGRRRTEKKLAKLRQGEPKSEVSYDVSLLNERLLELMQLHRTPEVSQEIENVKELLRLASSLSVEASIEAAEGNEEIARELANSRAREIGAELQRTRERLMLEKRALGDARKELNDIYGN